MPAALIAAAVGVGMAIAPAVAVDSYRASVTGPGTTREEVAWDGPDRASLRGRDRGYRYTVVRSGGSTIRKGGNGPGIVERRSYAARPDAYWELDELRGVTDYALAQARAGTAPFQRRVLDGRAALVTQVPLRANECAGLVPGTEQVWLDPFTLLPLRRVVTRGAERSVVQLGYRGLNDPVPAPAFAPPSTGAGAIRIDEEFVRADPRAAARNLSYRPELPGDLPPGFFLATSGWARKSGHTGPEASNPRYADLFAAVYARGGERIDVTQRRAGGPGSFPSDPFGAECQFVATSRVTIRGAAGWFGTSPEAGPHLWWRRGRILYTVAGPFPRRDLLTIAESLAPV